jgi:hypothetical protein
MIACRFCNVLSLRHYHFTLSPVQRGKRPPSIDLSGRVTNHYSGLVGRGQEYESEDVGSEDVTY